MHELNRKLHDRHKCNCREKKETFPHIAQFALRSAVLRFTFSLGSLQYGHSYGTG